MLLCWGRNFTHANFIKEELRKFNFNVPDKIREGLEGYSNTNICNRNMRNMGIQLEVSQGLRAELFSNQWKEYQKRLDYLSIYKVVPMKDRLYEFIESLFIANQRYLNLP